MIRLTAAVSRNYVTIGPRVQHAQHSTACPTVSAQQTGFSTTVLTDNKILRKGVHVLCGSSSTQLTLLHLFTHSDDAISNKPECDILM